MAYFNRGPSYGLSAEVRSKVSDPTRSAPFVSRGEKQLSDVRKVLRWLFKLVLTRRLVAHGSLIFPLTKAGHQTLAYSSKWQRFRVQWLYSRGYTNFPKFPEIVGLRFCFAVVINESPCAQLIFQRSNETRGKRAREKKGMCAMVHFFQILVQQADLPGGFSWSLQ